MLVDEAQDLTPDAVADGRPPRPDRDLDDRRRRRPSRRGRCPAESAAARAAALEGKDLHEFHLSTNYRNSSEIYDYAAAYAARVGLDADLPDRGPLDRRRAASR